MFKNMKIRRKLTVAFIIVTVISSIAGVLGFWLLLSIDNSYSNALVNNGFSQGDVGRFNTYLNKASALLRDIVFLSDDAEIADAQAEWTEVTAKADAALVQVKKVCNTPEEEALITTIETELTEYRKTRDTVIELGLANQNTQALALFREQAKPHLDACINAAEELQTVNQNLGVQKSTDLTNQSRFIASIIVATIVISLIASILFAMYIARTISMPIISCSNRLELFSQGDLSTPVEESNAKDETGIMLRALQATVDRISGAIADVAYHLGEVAKGNLTTTITREYRGDFIPLRDSTTKIIDSLNDAMMQINQSSQQVASGSDQVASGAQALSQGATEQASSVEELAATVNEISSQIKLTAEHSASVSQHAGKLGEELVESNQQMQTLIAAMGEISSTSNQIGKIIKVIEDIAFQTNILALNAAVEAARAGAAGKGFAVVADEVRNLAGKSAEAAKDTTSLIESSISAVENGTGLAGRTADSLLSVVENAKMVVETIDSISTAANEQADSIHQVTQGIDQISAVVQTNSATAEESAAASEELSGQAQMLKDLVKRFQIKNAQNDTFAPERRVPASSASYSSHSSFDGSSKY